MRQREKIIGNLETAYREAYTAAEEAGDDTRMGALELEFQRDQLMLEVLLDVRDALGRIPESEAPADPSLLDRAKAVRKFTRLGR